MTLAEFELFTLDFLRKKVVDQGDYSLSTLAVTVLSQRKIHPDNSTQPVFRKLESETWSVALEVDIRTVSVVTDGRVPQNFNFTQEILLGFYNHWDQYLWQLGNSVDFFSPLVGVSDWVPQQNEAAIGEKTKLKATFVFAVLFSFVAFGLALYASYLAIRKHLSKTGMTPHKNKSRSILFSPRNSPTNYSGADVLNYLTQTMSEDKNSPVHYYHDGDVEGGGALHFMRNVNIDIDENGMESVVLTPRGNFQSPHASVRNGLFVVNEGSDDDRSPMNDASPMEEELQQRPGSGRIGGQIKKWLTPRALKNGYTMSSSSPSRRLSSDPPENQSTMGYNVGRDNLEPFAKKASTKNDFGVYTTDKSTVDCRSSRSKATGISYKKKRSDEGQFTLPMSFFSNRGPGTNVSGAESPLSSLADSEASSFFGIGNMNKTFTGQRSTTGALEDEGYEVTSVKTKTNDPRSNNVIAAVVKPDQQKRITEQDENIPAAYVRSLLSPREDSAKDSDMKLAAKRFEPHRQHKQQEQKPLREIRPPNSTVGVETILGARSRDSADDESDKGSNASSAFLKSRSIFSPGERKRDKQIPTKQPKMQHISHGYGKVSVEVQEQEAARSEASTSTLGARPMERKDQDRDDKSTVSAFSALSSVMRRPGSYDVYAPSGPIGIVVDTSKDGPSVHSLKSTSPMLGLITPGDLIIALDGEDTRKMTAAALTRLMARRSRQKERKITLIS